MKKLIAVCLALLLLLSLAACGAQTETKPAKAQAAEAQPAEAQPAEQPAETAQTEESEDPPAPDFTLTDQYGKEHRLSEYKGKVVMLNFWATWCPSCIAEMPDLQKLYEKESAKETPELILLGVAAPGVGKEQDEEGVKAFLKERGWTYPTLMDRDGSVFTTYGASGLPTTFVINREGGVFGYIPGAMSEEILQKVVEQALGVTAEKEE